jgi:hypothetical protein
MASEESINCAPIPSVKAICTKNIDPWRQKSCDELHVGETYIPDYFVIGKSWSYLCIREFPENEYNTVIFDYQEDDGRHLDVSLW